SPREPSTLSAASRRKVDNRYDRRHRRLRRSLTWETACASWLHRSDTVLHYADSEHKESHDRRAFSFPPESPAECVMTTHLHTLSPQTEALGSSTWCYLSSSLVTAPLIRVR